MSSLEEDLAALATAGLTAADVEAVVQTRVRRRREEAISAAAALRGAHIGAGVGATGPEEHRYGKGPRLTDTDLYGAGRAIAAGIAYWEHAAEHVDVDEVRRITVHGVARREAEGKHETNVDLVASATN
jgi:hypothetical protein